MPVKSQSAMEYLMTYGWAILIIAVVLSVLFQLGVFSSGNFQPHAQAGACQVSKTVAGVSLEGQCNGVLPQYVAQFNGQSSYITLPANSVMSTAGSFSVSAWFTTTNNGVIVYVGSAQMPNEPYSWLNPLYVTQSGLLYGGDDNGPIFETTNAVSNGAWHFAVLTQNTGSQIETLYLDGAQVGVITSHLGSSITPYYWTIGGGSSSGANWPGLPVTSYFNGKIANVQMYNTSLSGTEIQTLYLEGIGGAPVRPQNLTGWWPLNGNANDYSGNGNNGQLNGVTFSSSWESGYTAP